MLGVCVRLLELANGGIRGCDVFQNIGLLVSVRVQRVVRLLRLPQGDERLGEVSDFQRKLPHGLPLQTRILARPCSCALYARYHDGPMNRPAGVATNQRDIA